MMIIFKNLKDHGPFATLQNSQISPAWDDAGPAYDVEYPIAYEVSTEFSKMLRFFLRTLNSQFFLSSLPLINDSPYWGALIHKKGEKNKRKAQRLNRCSQINILKHLLRPQKLQDLQTTVPRNVTFGRSGSPDGTQGRAPDGARGHALLSWLHPFFINISLYKNLFKVVTLQIAILKKVILRNLPIIHQKFHQNFLKYFKSIPAVHPP